MDSTPQLAAHLPELPSLLHSGAFLISNNMAASSAASSGLVTPINELPPSIMGDSNPANSDPQQQLSMDYFDFDLSSFGMDGLASTGINLEAAPEVEDQPRMAASEGRTMETRDSSRSLGDAGTIWENNVDPQNGNATNVLATTTLGSRGELLHEQVSFTLSLGMLIDLRLPILFLPLGLINVRLHDGSGRYDSSHSFICSHQRCLPSTTDNNYDKAAYQLAFSRENKEMATISTVTEGRISQSRLVHMA